MKQIFTVRARVIPIFIKWKNLVCDRDFSDQEEFKPENRIGTLEQLEQGIVAAEKMVREMERTRISRMLFGRSSNSVRFLLYGVFDNLVRRNNIKYHKNTLKTQNICTILIIGFRRIGELM